MEIDTEFEQHRFDTFFSKEPETIRWIDELVRPGDVFYDVGANMGVYTLYAALVHGPSLDVYAFEPAYHNYEKLCRNLLANRFPNVRAYGIALSDSKKNTFLRLASTVSGSASHSISEARESMHDAAASFDQGIVTLPVDSLVSEFKFPIPNHIKIDVDGYEEEVIRGAERTLHDSSLRTVLIEVSDAGGSKKRIEEVFSNAGFSMDHPINHMPGHSRERRLHAGTGHIENIIFTRT